MTMEIFGKLMVLVFLVGIGMVLIPNGIAPTIGILFIGAAGYVTRIYDDEDTKAREGKENG